MDLEAIQILNLSPIPELSEVELSTMLEHLSGLSDINGDLTDRNVEDILKEAEDLLDKSSSSKIHESMCVNKSTVAEENILAEISQHLNKTKDKDKDKEQNLQPSDVEESKQQTISVSSNSQMNTLSEQDKQCNSSVENSSILYSPGSSSNPIKSTIDSLKEFSTLIEKKLSDKSQNSSPKHIETTKNNQNESSNKVTLSNNSLNKKSVDIKSVPLNMKIIETSNSISKKNLTDSLENSVKLLNCFERLYRDKPGRLSSQKPKVVDKLPKAVMKKKVSKDLKNYKKNNWEGKTKKLVEEGINAKTYQNAKTYFQQTLCDEEARKENQKISKNLLHDECSNFSDNFQNDDGLKLVQPQTDEKLMLRVLEGVEELKDQVKKASAQTQEKIPKEVNKDIEILRASSEEAFEQDFQDSGIKRLEEQFCLLKEKYDRQIDKLETENLKLREALNRQQETFISQDLAKIDNGGTVLNSWTPEKQLSRTFSLENCKAPKNSPCSSSEDVQTSTTVKEASSQTERTLKNTGIQCEEEDTNKQPEMKKTENKENLLSKKKVGKNKPFSYVNVGIRQKKATEHETQLLATLRGLQAEVSAKDKENRKLKSEIESLKKQMKKIGNIKVDNCRRCNVGTQTIGLGAFLQKPYNPENFEVPYEFEKENEDLRSRIKALEEDFEFLKEKRITDLQSLHQVHEEEMAKLVSKLETQSALTKHLHSLLVNR